MIIHNLKIYSEHVVATILVSYLLAFLLGKVFKHFLNKTHFLNEKRRETYLSAFHSYANYVALGVSLLAVLSPFIDLTKALQAVGIVGIIIGFSVQSIIKSLFTGFLILYEKQFHQGDYVTINQQYSGTVEKIGLFMVHVRQYDGQLLSMQHAQITEILNGSEKKRRVIENVLVSYQENPKRVLGMLSEICDDLNECCAEQLLPEEKFQVLGMSPLTTSPLGMEYTITGLVRDDEYGSVIQTVRQALAQKIYQKKIRVAEQTLLLHKK